MSELSLLSGGQMVPSPCYGSIAGAGRCTSCIVHAALLALESQTTVTKMLSWQEMHWRVT
jgi:hypothetical protein